MRCAGKTHRCDFVTFVWQLKGVHVCVFVRVPVCVCASVYVHMFMDVLCMCMYTCLCVYEGKIHHTVSVKVFCLASPPCERKEWVLCVCQRVFVDILCKSTSAVGGWTVGLKSG